jgi:hypothetical protein
VVLNREITIYRKLSITQCSQSYIFSKSFPVNFISPGWLFIIFFASNPLLRKNGGLTNSFKGQPSNSELC